MVIIAVSGSGACVLIDDAICNFCALNTAAIYSTALAGSIIAYDSAGIHTGIIATKSYSPAISATIVFYQAIPDCCRSITDINTAAVAGAGILLNNAVLNETAVIHENSYALPDHGHTIARNQAIFDITAKIAINSSTIHSNIIAEIAVGCRPASMNVPSAAIGRGRIAYK